MDMSTPPTAQPQGLALVEQWLELARKDSRHASYGVPAPGSLPQFIGYQLGSVSRTPLLSVPYRGAAPVTQDLVGGQLAFGA